MNEPFNIPVIYQGTEHELKARLERWGYTHRIAVLIEDTTVTFEPDEEGAYRAIGLLHENNEAKTISADFLLAVSEKLRTLL